MNKIKIPNVTLCCIGSEKYKNQQQQALDYSSKNIEFGAVKNIIVNTTNINEWNEAVVFDLGGYIDTDYALLIHPDGFVIHPEMWNEEWLKYDFIGAPFPLPKDDFSYRDINGKIQRVGNSVSLRSKKLLDLPKKINMEWKSFHGYYNEDGYISVNMPIPENKGVKTFCFHKNFGENHNYPNFEKQEESFILKIKKILFK